MPRLMTRYCSVVKGDQSLIRDSIQTGLVSDTSKPTNISAFVNRKFTQFTKGA